MSWQPHCAIAHQRVTYGFATAILTVKPHVRNFEPSIDLGRWSG